MYIVYIIGRFRSSKKNIYNIQNRIKEDRSIFFNDCSLECLVYIP